MKGVIYSRAPALRIVDLTHEVLVHWPAEAGFWLSRVYRHFPSGTVHLAVVDPGVGSTRAIAVVECAGQIFLAPDNGLLAPVVDSASDCTLRILDLGQLAGLGLASPSATFHGRDIFAPVAAELAAGRIAPAALGAVASALTPGWLEPPRVAPGLIAGVVVTVDHFGNLITNIEGGSLRSLRLARVRVAGRELPIQRTYAESRPGDYLALVNAFGVLEVARAEQSAALGLGLTRGAPVSVVHSST